MNEGQFVLLVEDNEDDELLILRAFKKSRTKKDIVVVRDGEEALEFIFCTGRYAHRNVQHQPEAVMLDLKLPKLNGHQVLERIRKNESAKHLPVVILTSSHEESDLQRSYAGGANSYIVKPVDSSEFSSLIQQMGVYWADFNRTPVK